MTKLVFKIKRMFGLAPPTPDQHLALNIQDAANSLITAINEARNVGLKGQVTFGDETLYLFDRNISNIRVSIYRTRTETFL